MKPFATSYSTAANIVASRSVMSASVIRVGSKCSRTAIVASNNARYSALGRVRTSATIHARSVVANRCPVAITSARIHATPVPVVPAS